jgi:hypothetical protein
MNIAVHNEFGNPIWEGDLGELILSNEGLESWEIAMLEALCSLDDARVILGDEDEPFFVEAA